MRRVGIWAVAVLGAAMLNVPACLTSPEEATEGAGVKDPPVTHRGGSTSSGTGGDAGEDTGGSGGRGGTNGTSGSRGDGGDSGCDNDGDCAFRPDNRSRCSVPTGECVDCLDPSDCTAGEECIDNECRTIRDCSSTSDCPSGLVCNTATYRCVECVGSLGCAAGEVCVANACRRTCSTDSHCTPFGLRCNTSSGYCADCLSEADCPETHFCQQGSCVRDICAGGTSQCEAGGLSSCNEAGSVLNPPVPCAAQQTCVEDSTGARCEPWICVPSTTTCALTGERVVTCSEDGLEETLVEDCEAAMQLCIGNACSDGLCEPSMLFCQANTIQQCDTTGTSSVLYQNCPANQFCNPATVTCGTRVCNPGQPACDGEVATTCNTDGFGYTGTRTDCAGLGQLCGPSGCSTSAVDTIPASPTLYGSELTSYGMFNFYSATRSRTLTLIEQYMSISSATMLTWQVYEATAQTGTYTSIFSTATTSTTGAEYQSSQAVTVSLVAGRFYAIGVSWTSPGVNFGYQSAAPSQVVSFGSLLSATIQSAPPPTSFAWTAASSYFFPQRLTTAIP